MRYWIKHCITGESCKWRIEDVDTKWKNIQSEILTDSKKDLKPEKKGGEGVLY